MKITKIHYNWMFSTDSDYGEEYKVAEVGINNVVQISDRSEPGVTVFRIHYSDGGCVDVYNPNTVFWSPNQ